MGCKMKSDGYNTEFNENVISEGLQNILRIATERETLLYDMASAWMEGDINTVVKSARKLTGV